MRLFRKSNMYIHTYIFKIIIFENLILKYLKIKYFTFLTQINAYER